MATMNFLLLFVVLASPSAFAQLTTITTSTTNTWPPPSSDGTCNNTISDDLLAWFSPFTAFSSVVLNSIAYVDSVLICHTDCEAAALIAPIKVFLWYGTGETDYEEETLENMNNLLTGNHWDYNRSTICFFPGWTKDATSDYSRTVSNAYVLNGNYNVLVIDWPTRQEYTTLVCQMPYIGNRVAKALDSFSTASGGKLTEMDLVGHSLGAHMCGYTARNCLIMIIGKIFGLDPAGPLFADVPWLCDEGLRTDDAPYVMTLNSDIARFGNYIRKGWVNYFANNGTAIQPGCTESDMNLAGCADKFACSHNKVLPIWAQAIRFPGSIIGYHCPSPSAFAAGMCDNHTTNVITESTSVFGDYYFNTGGIY